VEGSTGQMQEHLAGSPTGLVRGKVLRLACHGF